MPVTMTTSASALPPQWSGQSCCFFCPADRSPTLLVSTVAGLQDRLVRLLGIAAPFAERIEAICRSCLRNLDELEQASVLRETMRGHFESQHGNDIERELGFTFVVLPTAGAAAAPSVAEFSALDVGREGFALHSGEDGSSGRRMCGSRPAMNLRLPSRVASVRAIPGADPATAADDQRSQTSGDDGGSTGGGELTVASAGRSQRKADRKWYSCSECNKMFGAKSHYDDHVTKHSNAKQFECPLCGRAFKFKRGLREHARENHGSNTHSGLDGEALLRQYSAGDQGFSAASAGGESADAARVKVEDSTEPTAEVADSCDDSTSQPPPVLQDSSADGGADGAFALPELEQPAAGVLAAAGGYIGGGSSSHLAAVAPAMERRGLCGSSQRPHDDDVPPPLDDECRDVDVECMDHDDDEDGGHYEDQDSDVGGVGGGEDVGATSAAVTLRVGSAGTSDRQSSSKARRPGTLLRQSSSMPSSKRQLKQPADQQQQRRQRQQSVSPDPVFAAAASFAGSPHGSSRGSAGEAPASGGGSFPCVLCPSRFKYKRGLVSHVKRKHLDNECSSANDREVAQQTLGRLGNPRLLAAARKRSGLPSGAGGGVKQQGSASGGRLDGVATVAAGFERREEASDAEEWDDEGEDGDEDASLQATSADASADASGRGGRGKPERQAARSSSSGGSSSAAAQTPGWLAELKWSADRLRFGGGGSSHSQAASPASANGGSNSSCDGSGSQPESRKAAARTASAVSRAPKRAGDADDDQEESRGPDDSSEAAKREAAGSTDHRSSGGSSGSSKRLRLGEEVSTVRA